MAVYTYHDWITQSTTAGQITRLRLHIAEVALLVAREVSADGKSVGSNSTQRYLDSLYKRLDGLMAMPDATGAVNGGMSLVDFRQRVGPDGRISSYS